MHNIALQRIYNMEICSFGVGERIGFCEQILRERAADLPCGRLVLLPIPTSRDNRYITGTTAEHRDILHLVDSTTAVVGYNIPPRIIREAENVGARVYDAEGDEVFLVENAELTARGTIGYILTNEKRDLSELSIGVIGYGRIGMRLVRWLLLFGADVTVYTRRQSLAIELCEMGISAVVPGGECDLSGLDILINTAPERQIDDNSLSEKTKLIDLASGNVFASSARVIRLPGLPEQMYPMTAGRLYAEGVIRNLRGDTQ